MRRLRKSRHTGEGLPKERKALAERYTIDAAEAERREVIAAEVPAWEVERTSFARVASQLEPPSATGERPTDGDLRRTERPQPRPNRLSNLKDHIGQVVKSAGVRKTNPHDTKTMQYFLSVYRTRNPGD